MVCKDENDVGLMVVYRVEKYWRRAPTNFGEHHSDWGRASNYSVATGIDWVEGSTLDSNNFTANNIYSCWS